MLVKKSMLKNRSTVARLSYKRFLMNIQSLHDNRGGAARCPKGGFSERERPSFVAQNMAFRCKSECLNVLRSHTQDWRIQANRRKIFGRASSTASTFFKTKAVGPVSCTSCNIEKQSVRTLPNIIIINIIQQYTLIKPTRLTAIPCLTRNDS